MQMHMLMLMQVGSFNKALAKKCAAYGLPFFDAYPMTANATSFDGIHYGIQVNVLKAQVLLNFIQELKMNVVGHRSDSRSFHSSAFTLVWK
jgi:hypothetical protein